MDSSGRAPTGQALVSDGAASVSTLSGFDPSREAYLFTNGWWMMRELERPFYWILSDNRQVRTARDKYRHDLIERFRLRVQEHYDPCAIAIEARSGETGTGSTEGKSAAIARKEDHDQ